MEGPLDQELIIDENVEFGFDISFGDGQILDGEPVVPTLKQFCELVEGVFDAAEKQILI